jgi:magnesium transporter
VFIGLLNGILWSFVIGLAVFFWFNSFKISLIIAVSIVLNLIIAALSGVLLPSLLGKLKIDPALAGGVVLTTITDVIGFVVFLGLAALFI